MNKQIASRFTHCFRMLHDKVAHAHEDLTYQAFQSCGYFKPEGLTCIVHDSNHAFEKTPSCKTCLPSFTNIIANILQPKRHKGQLQGLSKNSANSGNPPGSPLVQACVATHCRVALCCTSSICFVLKSSNRSLKYEDAQTAVFGYFTLFHYPFSLQLGT